MCTVAVVEVSSSSSSSSDNNTRDEQASALIDTASVPDQMICILLECEVVFAGREGRRLWTTTERRSLAYADGMKLLARSTVRTGTSSL